jgi:hypothetical protein
MTFSQLKSLTDDELQLLFYVVNVLSPTTLPQIEYDYNSITWIRHQLLIQKLISVEPQIKDEFKEVFDRLMSKL